jgi:hypothetical protein
MVSVALTKFTGALTADAAASEGIVTEEGAVNYRRNGLGGVTRFTPICGESRFSDFTVPGTGAGAAMYSGSGVQPYVEWPYFYNRRESPSRTIWRVDLTSGALTQATTSPGSGATQYHGVTSRPELSYIDGIRGLTAALGEVREWNKASEPSAATSQLFTLPSPYDFNHFHLDADENYWLGGVDGWVFKVDFGGSTIWSNQLPVNAAAVDYCNGLFVPDGIGGGIAFLEQSDGEMDWFFVDGASGVETDITASVTIDGVPWDTVAPGAFGDPNVVTTQWGNRIGFKIGTDFYIGVVWWGNRWWVGGVAWGSRGAWH